MKKVTAKVINKITVNFSQYLIHPNGDPISFPKQVEGTNKIEMEVKTLGVICADALFATFEEDRELTGTQKNLLGELGAKIYKGGEVQLTSEEASTIKKRIASGYGPLVVFLINQIIP